MKGGGGPIKEIGRYKIFLNDKLGEGGFGEVYIGIDKQTMEKVAVKVLDKKKIDASQYHRNCIQNQVRLLRATKSKYIVNYKDIEVTKNNYYVFQELCDLDLASYIETKGKVPEEEAINILKDVLQGIYQLIVHGVVHRDLKPENIMFRDGMAKIGDLGFAQNCFSNSVMLHTQVGTKIYQSPQVYYGKKYTFKCDIWSFGVIFYELLYGNKKFPHKQFKIRSFYSDTQNWSKQYLDFDESVQVSESTKQLIKKCLRYQEKDRISWKQIFAHPIFKQYLPQINLLEDNLKYFVKKIKSILGNEKNIEIMFDKFQNSHHNCLKEKEFCKMIKSVVGEQISTIHQLKYIFRHFDLKMNGMISLQQLKAILSDQSLMKLTQN